MSKEVVEPTEINSGEENTRIFEYDLRVCQTPDVRLVFSASDWEKIDLSGIQAPAMQLKKGNEKLWVWPPYLVMTDTVGASFNRFKAFYIDFNGRVGRTERVPLMTSFLSSDGVGVERTASLELMKVGQEAITENGVHVWSRFGLITFYGHQHLIKGEICDQVNKVLNDGQVNKWRDQIEIRLQRWHGPIEVRCDVMQLVNNRELTAFEPLITLPETEMELLRNGDRLAIIKTEKVVETGY